MPKNNKGFTLVELLIVIGLLGALALIVISAINPIEQSNRTKDTRFKTDGGQLISAIDRYFAAHSSFPWVDAEIKDDNDAAFGFVSASNQGVGVCGATCSEDGLLVTTDELKTEFSSRDFMTATADDKKLLIGKEEGSSSSIYACFIPSSKAFRSKAVQENKVYTISLADGSRTPTDACDATAANWASNKCYVCIPE